MTKEEHIARAMLLGMLYNENWSYYIDFERRDTFTGHHYYRLDADTLEEISGEETKRRQGMMDHD